MANFVERKRWLFLGLPFTFTKYTVEEDKVIIKSGLFTIKEDTCFMYKILDVRLERSLLERIAGMGTVKCYTSDVTSKSLVLLHVKNSKAISDFILNQSEEMRLKRRTLNTMNLTQGLDGIDDVDLDD